MKKTLKMKALFFSMILSLLCVTVVPTVNAGEKWYDNQVEEDEADIVASIMADKTEVRPGDELTVTFKVDKMPDNNEGVKAINARIAYDPTKLTIQQTDDGRGHTVPYIVPGVLGDELGIELGTAGTVTDVEADKVPNVDYAHKLIGIGNAVATPAITLGTVVEIKFTVNEGATGNLGMFIYPIKSNNDEGLDPYSGFNAAGATYNNELNMYETDLSSTYYLNYNVDEVEVVNPATNVYFDRSSITLDTEVKTSENLSQYVVIVPEDSTDNDPLEWDWDSSDDKVATVDNNGIVTAVGKGTANITVTIGNCTATIPVTVTVPVTGVEFEGLTSVDLDLTTKPQMSIKDYVKVSPENAEVTAYNWRSDNEKVATVDNNGVVTAVGKGTANIIVEVSDHEATIPVNVKASVGSVSFDVPNVVLDTKTETQYKLKDHIVFDPEGAEYTEITWKSSDDKVATVDDDGNVTAVGNGDATITVTVDGKSATIPVSVTVPLESITIEDDNVTVYKNKEVNVKVTANPDGAKWRTLDPSIKSGGEYANAEETEDGVKITGLAEGTAVVTVAANDGTTPELVKEITVQVKENRITSVDVTAENDEDLLRGATKQLKTSYEVEEPGVETTDETKVSWESSDTEVATVDGNGVVTGIKEGKATITATIAGKSDTYEVTVKEVHAEGIVISDETIENLQNAQPVVGDTLEIPFTVNPEDCTDIEEEILEFVKTQFDEEMVDVTVSYDQETKTGTISVTTKKAGTTEVTVEAGEETYVMSFNVTEPVVETPEEEAPETGDMPVVAMAIIMTLSIVGIVASRKLLVK